MKSSRSFLMLVFWITWIGGLTVFTLYLNNAGRIGTDQAINGVLGFLVSLVTFLLAVAVSIVASLIRDRYIKS